MALIVGWMNRHFAGPPAVAVVVGLHASSFLAAALDLCCCVCHTRRSRSERLISESLAEQQREQKALMVVGDELSLLACGCFGAYACGENHSDILEASTWGFCHLLAQQLDSNIDRCVGVSGGREGTHLLFCAHLQPQCAISALSAAQRHQEQTNT